ncbi:hypothetical protein FOL47_002358 [Perkinsus chesapeaki]|uniref:Methyltransferase type 11 domain-containing protein n=1 Tax=Perkinsus chesapeaki TaxID=330153 RepID=A0A7J6MFJ7_PERCH|nr:hypothetical protein FOL47_002358 [Perkinsus chesapeaki]
MSNAKVFASTLGTVSVLVGGMYLGNYGFAGREKRYKDEDLPTEKRRRKIFDEVAASWDYKVRLDEYLMGLTRWRRQLLANAEGDVLEVAVGTGRNFQFYNAKQVKSVTAIDFSRRMLETAEKKRHLLDPIPLRLKSGNCASMKEFPDKSFDTVVDTFGICSFEDPSETLLEIKRVCRGKVLLLEHGQSTYPLFRKYLHNTLIKHVEKFGCYNNREILRLVKQSGMKILQVQRKHFGATYYIVCEAHPEVEDECDIKDEANTSFTPRSTTGTKSSAFARAASAMSNIITSLACVERAPYNHEKLVVGSGDGVVYFTEGHICLRSTRLEAAGDPARSAVVYLKVLRKRVVALQENGWCTILGDQHQSKSHRVAPVGERLIGACFQRHFIALQTAENPLAGVLDTHCDLLKQDASSLKRLTASAPTAPCTCVAASANYIIVGCSDGGKLYIYRKQHGPVRATVSLAIRISPEDLLRGANGVNATLSATCVDVINTEAGSNDKGLRVAVGYSNGFLVIFDISAEATLMTLKDITIQYSRGISRASPITACHLSSLGSHCAAGCHDGLAYLLTFKNALLPNEEANETDSLVARKDVFHGHMSPIDTVMFVETGIRCSTEGDSSSGNIPDVHKYIAYGVWQVFVSVSSRPYTATSTISTSGAGGLGDKQVRASPGGRFLCYSDRTTGVLEVVDATNVERIASRKSYGSAVPIGVSWVDNCTIVAVALDGTVSIWSIPGLTPSEQKKKPEITEAELRAMLDQRDDYVEAESDSVCGSGDKENHEPTHEMMPIRYDASDEAESFPIGSGEATPGGLDKGTASSADDYGVLTWESPQRSMQRKSVLEAERTRQVTIAGKIGENQPGPTTFPWKEEGFVAGTPSYKFNPSGTSTDATSSDVSKLIGDSKLSDPFKRNATASSIPVKPSRGSFIKIETSLQGDAYVIDVRGPKAADQHISKVTADLGAQILHIESPIDSNSVRVPIGFDLSTRLKIDMRRFERFGSIRIMVPRRRAGTVCGYGEKLLLDTTKVAA